MKQRLPLLFVVICISSALMWGALSCISIEKKEPSQEEVVTQITPLAESAIVMDMGTTRVLYAHQEKKKMLPASITKILTCITCLEYYSLDDLVVVGKEVLQSEGSAIYLKIGDVISIKDLLYGLMLCSGNDAAIVLAYHLNQNESDFVYLMNKVAKKIGMKDSIFSNPSGLDSKTQNYTTAYDMALLMSYAMKNEMFRTIVSTKNYQCHIATGTTMYFRNKHRLIQSGLATGGKTGYTKQARRTLVSTFAQSDFEIVVVTLNCSNDWYFHEQLANYAFSKYQSHQVLSLFEFYKATYNYGKYDVKNLHLTIPIQANESIFYQLIVLHDGVDIVYLIEDEVIGHTFVKQVKT
ncbi:MAG: D-alanyl-D-alanine carboxypeptidase [Prevotella sp.]|nr:D-alanyl-D-alanine carboxypeptidase [Staphylococcus sp.]MCM1349655.1 D-alanyl-D-alanine carboxypeptidase [Prevotella sp.]